MNSTRGRTASRGVLELVWGSRRKGFGPRWLGENSMPSYCGGYLYIERPWCSSQILSGKGANNGHFEGEHLVQAILTKVGLRLPKALAMTPS